jgi:hypothetical protein
MICRTSALTTISTGSACTLATVPACARNLSRRCTSVTDFAIGWSDSAQSNAESPPPTITTFCPARSSRCGTK